MNVKRLLRGLPNWALKEAVNWVAIIITFGPALFVPGAWVSALDLGLRPFLGRWALDGSITVILGVCLLAFIIVHAALARLLGLARPFQPDEKKKLR